MLDSTKVGENVLQPWERSIDNSVVNRDLKRFCKGKSKVKRKWFVFTNARIYLRLTERYIDGQTYKCIDIASITVQTEANNKGIATNLIQKVEGQAATANRIVFIENVLHEALLHILKKRNYKKIETLTDDETIPCFILTNPKPNDALRKR